MLRRQQQQGDALFTRIHTALERTQLFKGLTSADAVKIDVNCEDKKKDVLPQLLRGGALTRFNDEFVPCMKELKQWFGGIQREITLVQARQLFERARNSRRLKDQSPEFKERLLSRLTGSSLRLILSLAWRR